MKTEMLFLGAGASVEAGISDAPTIFVRTFRCGRQCMVWNLRSLMARNRRRLQNGSWSMM